MLPIFSLDGDAAAIGESLAAFYRHLAGQPPQTAPLWHACLNGLQVDPALPLCNAGHAIAVALDAGHYAGVAQGYHNRVHYVEVLLNAAHCLFCHQQDPAPPLRLTMPEQAMLLFAALSHDLAYQPGGNRDSAGTILPCQQEQIAVRVFTPYLVAQQVEADTIATIQGMVYCTDVSKLPSGCNAHRLLQAALPNPVGYVPDYAGWSAATLATVAAPLNRVLANPRTCFLAALLADADILSSAGLTYAYSVAQSQKLAKEWGQSTALPDVLGNLCHFLQPLAQKGFLTSLATFFLPNTKAILCAVRANTNGPKY